MSHLDKAFLMLVEWIAPYSPQTASIVAVPLFALAVTALITVLIRRLLPLAIRVFGIPGLIAVIALVGTVVLSLQLGLAWLWRLFRARPPSIVYAVGDLTVGALSRVRRVRPGLAPTLYQLETISIVLLLAIGAVLLWRWNVTFCARLGEAACTAPVSDFWAYLGL